MTTKFAFVLGICLASVGCGSDDSLELKLRVFTDGVYHQEQIDALLEGSSEILGVELVKDSDGPITVELSSVYQEPAGRYFPYGLCRHHIRSEYDAVTLSHELGHALGLKHVPDSDNLMAAYAGREVVLAEWQRELIERSARALALCP